MMRRRPCMPMNTMPANTVVHPTKYNQVHTCSESVVNHIHPSHTNCVNHHLVKNVHYYPHTTSNQYTVDQINVNGGPVPPMYNQMGMNPGNFPR
ncbi:Inner spore coat protein D [Gracilibacillus ureilyticus]|uniref:Inner spore coat protein D n=1 Tax=Gracilibacillus ureilyticus TaxID=531814 RepID=A0A1H9LLB0_9BACI|nr:CotD family spore coat protein [Gracilibacillus ureilyticus]SER12200.1 Inner spore coat protein D [Gracilibacillus ureilyticus]